MVALLSLACVIAACAGNSNCTLVITNDSGAGVTIQTPPQG